MVWWWRSKPSATATTPVEPESARAGPSPSHVLRPIEPRDDRAIDTILRTVMVEFGVNGAGTSISDAEVSAMSAAYSAPRAAYFVVESEGQVVGGGGIGPLQGGEFGFCELRKMYFLPEARGHGTGARLLNQCLRAARGFGYRVCYLETAHRHDRRTGSLRAGGLSSARQARRCHRPFRLRSVFRTRALSPRVSR